VVVKHPVVPCTDHHVPRSSSFFVEKKGLPIGSSIQSFSTSIQNVGASFLHMYMLPFSLLRLSHSKEPNT